MAGMKCGQHGVCWRDTYYERTSFYGLSTGFYRMIVKFLVVLVY